MMAGAGVLIAILALWLPTGGSARIAATHHSPSDDYYRLPVCRPGTHFNADTATCSLCVDGLTYNEIHNRDASCKTCRTCGENEEQVLQCTINRNTRCSCHTDYYRSAEGVCIYRNATAVMGPGAASGTGAPGRAFMRTAPWSADPAQQKDTQEGRSGRSVVQVTTAGAPGGDSSVANTEAAANDPSGPVGAGGGGNSGGWSTAAPAAVALSTVVDSGAGRVSDDSRGQAVEASTSVTLNETTAASGGQPTANGSVAPLEGTTAGAAAVASDDPEGQPDASVEWRKETTTAADDGGAGGDAGGQTAAGSSPAVRQDDTSMLASEDPTSTDGGDGDGIVASAATEAAQKPEEPGESTAAADQPTDAATDGNVEGGDGDDYTIEGDTQASDDSSTAAPLDGDDSDQPDAPTEDSAASARDPGARDGAATDSHTTSRAEDRKVVGGHDGSRGGHDGGGKVVRDRGRTDDAAWQWRITSGVLVGVVTLLIVVGLVCWMFPKTRGYTINEQRPSVMVSSHYSQGDIEMTSQQRQPPEPADVVVAV